MLFNAGRDQRVCHEHLTALLSWMSHSQHTGAFLSKSFQNNILQQFGAFWERVEHRKSSKDHNHHFCSKYPGVLLCGDSRLNKHAVKEATIERFKEKEGAQQSTAAQRFQHRDAKTAAITWDLLWFWNPGDEEAAGKEAGITHSTYFYERVAVPQTLAPSTCQSQRCVHLISGLRFCTTCCLAQPRLQPRGGREPDDEAGPEPAQGWPPPPPPLPETKGHASDLFLCASITH